MSRKGKQPSNQVAEKEQKRRWNIAVSRVDCLFAGVSLANRLQAASLVGEMRLPRHTTNGQQRPALFYFYVDAPNTSTPRRPTVLHIAPLT
jgi:hypothetical protein